MFSGVQESFKKLYVPAKIDKLDTEISTRKTGEPKIICSINTYSDMFKYKRNIYIQGNPGSGKSTFCKKIVQDWCEESPNTVLQCGEESSMHFHDVSFLKQFDFLFLISLSKESGKECKVLRMIKDAIVGEFVDCDKYNFTFLENILISEKCLVILDGLDEWEHPCDSEICKSMSPVPHGLIGSNCHVITLTRPWKLNCVTLSDNDVWLKIDGVHDSKQLVDNVFACLNDKHFCNAPSKKEFYNQLCKFEQSLMSIPFLVAHLVCIWFDKENLPDTKSAIYASIVDMMLEPKENIRKEKCEKNEVHAVGIGYTLPRCFADANINCEKNKDLLYCLGKLAFCTLNSFLGGKEMVSFREETVKQFLTSKLVDKALLAGLLSQNKIPCLNKRQQKSFSFLHKTIQEFLAVYFIAATQNKNGKKTLVKKHLEKYKNQHPAFSFWFENIFLFGMDEYTARYFSELISVQYELELQKYLNNVTQNPMYEKQYGVNIVSQTLLKKGYAEAVGSGHDNSCVKIKHFITCICVNPLSDILDILDANSGTLESFLFECQRWIHKCFDKLDFVKLCQILKKSAKNLKRVHNRTTKDIDLTECCNLEYLFCKNNSSAIKTKRLKKCFLQGYDLSTPNCIASLKLSHSLQVLVLDCCKGISVLCKNLHLLTALERFGLLNTDLEFNSLTFAESLKYLELSDIYMKTNGWKTTITSLPSQLEKLVIRNARLPIQYVTQPPELQCKYQSKEDLAAGCWVHILAGLPEGLKYLRIDGLTVSKFLKESDTGFIPFPKLPLQLEKIQIENSCLGNRYFEFSASTKILTLENVKILEKSFMYMSLHLPSNLESLKVILTVFPVNRIIDFPSNLKTLCLDRLCIFPILWVHLLTNLPSKLETLEIKGFEEPEYHFSDIHVEFPCSLKTIRFSLDVTMTTLSWKCFVEGVKRCKNVQVILHCEIGVIPEEDKQEVLNLLEESGKFIHDDTDYPLNERFLKTDGRESMILRSYHWDKMRNLER